MSTETIVIIAAAAGLAVVSIAIGAGATYLLMRERIRQLHALCRRQ